MGAVRGDVETFTEGPVQDGQCGETPLLSPTIIWCLSGMMVTRRKKKKLSSSPSGKSSLGTSEYSGVGLPQVLQLLRLSASPPCLHRDPEALRNFSSKSARRERGRGSLVRTERVPQAKRATCVPRSGLDQGVSWFYNPCSLCIFHHPQADAVLHAASCVEVLTFCHWKSKVTLP